MTDFIWWDKDMKKYRKKYPLKPWQNALLAVLAVLFWVLVWHFGAQAANRTLTVKIPLPIETASIFVRDLTKPAFLAAVGASLWHILAGFLAAVLLGVLGALASSSSRIFEKFSAPLLHLFRCVPVAALIFLGWLWIPSALLPSLIAAIMVTPIVWSHAAAGIAAADERYAEMGRTYGMSEREITKKIRVPLISPYVRQGCVTGLGIAWKSGVAAEVISNPSGTVGALLQRGKATVEYGEVFAVTLAVILLSLILENVLKLVWKEKRHG